MTLNKGLFTSNTDEWYTPFEFYEELNKEFGFTLDPCCTHDNAKCKNHYTKEDNGLIKDWGGQIVFCNPPYGREIGKWVQKCSEESKKPGTRVVLLIPARTDTAYFHDYIYNKVKEVRFVRGRLKFGGAKCGAPFPSMVVVF